jgi:chaperonin GroES
MKLLGTNILVKPVDLARMTAGGIFLPEVANDTPFMMNQEGIVVAIGSAIRDSLEYTKGSRVFMEMYKPKPITIKGEPHLIVQREAIVGISVGDGEFHPIGNKILLKPGRWINHEGKIIRPSAYEHDEDSVIHCTVHLLGSGNRRKDGTIVPFEVSIGDVVAIKPMSGRDVEAADCIYKLVEEKDILLVIPQTSPIGDIPQTKI